MKKISFLFALTVSSILINSCKKDKDESSAPEPSPSYSNYSQLKVGNYWVYQQFEVDTNGIATALPKLDSCYVEKDSIINGLTYYKLVKPKPFATNLKEVFFERDSLHYVVSFGGVIQFSSQDFSTIFSKNYLTAGPGDTVCKIEQQMADKNQVVSTPAGNFTSLNFREKYSFYPGWQMNGAIRNKNKRYAENVGLVIETLPFFASNPKTTERRLLRYHLN